MTTTIVTARELARNAADVLDRVGRGERVEVTRNGRVAAVLIPPDAVTATMDALVGSGHVDVDWREEQAELRRWLADEQPLPAVPAQRSLSETIIADRDESA